jgi:hypothetical protein
MIRFATYRTPCGQDTQRDAAAGGRCRRTGLHADHRVRLSGAGLAVGEDGGREALERRVQQRLHPGLFECLLLRHRLASCARAPLHRAAAVCTPRTAMHTRSMVSPDLVVRDANAFIHLEALPAGPAVIYHCPLRILLTTGVRV